MELKDCANYTKHTYHIEEHFAWPQYPTTSVLIDPASQQWIAILLREWDEMRGEFIEALDIKVGRDYIADIMQTQPAGFGRAHRMNATEWIGVTLNNLRHNDDDVFAALDEAVARAHMSNIVIIGDQNHALNMTVRTDTNPALHIPSREEMQQSQLHQSQQTTYYTHHTKHTKPVEQHSAQHTTHTHTHPDVISHGFQEDTLWGDILTPAHTDTLAYTDPAEAYLESVVLPSQRNVAIRKRIESFTHAAFELRDYADHVTPWDTTLIKPVSDISYSMLSIQELRQYFTWRDALRKGTYIKAPVQFESLVCAEYFLGIGASSPQEVIALVLKLIDASEEAIQQIRSYGDTWRQFHLAQLRRWLHDYCIIHNMPHEARSVLENHQDVEHDACIHTLVHCNTDQTVTDEAIVKELCTLYPDLRKSPIIKKHHDVAVALVANIWKHCIAMPAPQSLHFGTHESLADIIFGKQQRTTWYPLPHLMININPSSPCVVSASDERIFEYNGSNWSVIAYPSYIRRTVLHSIVRTIDGTLRKQLKTGGYLRSATDPWAQQIIAQALTKIEEEQHLARLPQIDTSADTLLRIRTEALASQESLLTDAERMEEDIPARAAQKPSFHTHNAEHMEENAPARAAQLPIAEAHVSPQPCTASCTSEHNDNDADYKTICNTSSLNNSESAYAASGTVNTDTSTNGNHSSINTPAEELSSAAILQLLINDPSGQQATQTIIAHHQLPSVIADALNSAYWNSIGDALVEYDGSVLTIIEDYIDDAKALIAQEQ